MIGKYGRWIRLEKFKWNKECCYFTRWLLIAIEFLSIIWLSQRIYHQLLNLASKIDKFTRNTLQNILTGFQWSVKIELLLIYIYEADVSHLVPILEILFTQNHTVQIRLITAYIKFFCGTYKNNLAYQRAVK